MLLLNEGEHKLRFSHLVYYDLKIKSSILNNFRTGGTDRCGSENEIICLQRTQGQLTELGEKTDVSNSTKQRKQYVLF